MTTRKAPTPEADMGTVPNTGVVSAKVATKLIANGKAPANLKLSEPLKIATQVLPDGLTTPSLFVTGKLEVD